MKKERATRLLAAVFAALLAVVGLSGCETMKGWFGGGDESTSTAEEEQNN